MDWWLGKGHWLACLALCGVAAYFVHAETLRSGPPAGVRAFTDVVYRRTPDRVQRLDVYTPGRGHGPAYGYPALVAIHGGGWRGGTKNSYGREIARMARYGCVVVSVDYSLSRPGHPSWPDNLADVREAVRWVRTHASEYGIDPDRIAAFGSSAGGHLAALLGTNAGGDDPACRVQAVVDFYGPTDLVALYRVPKAVASLDLFFGQPPQDAPIPYAEASPIHHVSPRSAPMLLIHGLADPLVPLAQSTDLAARLQAAGVPARLLVVADVGHSFGLEVDNLDLAPSIITFLDEVWSRQTEHRSDDALEPTRLGLTPRRSATTDR
jgi:acetyl esterase/lipase